MDDKYAVLIAPRHRFTKDTRGAPAATVSIDDLLPKVEVVELAPSHVLELRQRESTLAVARTMPMKLIEPITAIPRPLDRHVDASTAWGIEATRAHTSPWTGEGTVIGILDTGIDRTHPAFAGMDLVCRDFTGEGDGDTNGHGTHCAGTAFGRDVDGTRIGVAQGVHTALIGKVLDARGGGTSDMIADAILWAVREGANVVSMSLGIDFPGYIASLVDQDLPIKVAVSRALEDYRHTIELFAATTRAVASQAPFGRCALLVGAAGNESDRNAHNRYTVAASPPSASGGVLSVAALGRREEGFEVASFSNVGARIAGPGVGVLSANLGGGLTQMSGTSMAAPHVAGVAALWTQKLANSDPSSIRYLEDRLLGAASSMEVLKVSADDIGVGLVQAPQD